MPKGIFDESEIVLTCPAADCGHQQRKTLRWLRDHADFVCEGCSRTIALDHEQFRTDFDQLDETIDDLRKTLGDLGKRR